MEMLSTFNNSVDLFFSDFAKQVVPAVKFPLVNALAPAILRGLL